MQTANSPGSDNPGGLGSELKQDAQKLGGVAGERLTKEAETHKGEIASQARSVSGALEKAAGELSGEDTPDWLRSSLRQGAETLQRLADTVERKNPGELVDDLNTLGREHPGAFLGACAVAGFAVARVFKAGMSGATGAQGGSTGYGGVAASPSATPSFNSPGANWSTTESTGTQGGTGLGQSYASSPYGGQRTTTGSDPLSTGYTEGAV